MVGELEELEDFGKNREMVEELEELEDAVRTKTRGFVVHGICRSPKLGSSSSSTISHHLPVLLLSSSSPDSSQANPLAARAPRSLIGG
jgi:hypothetical protein